MNEKRRFNVEQHTTLENKIIDVFPVSHQYIHELENELKYKPDNKITLQDDKGNKFVLIQTERIDMQKELTETINKLQQQNKKYKEVIDKVINFINNNGEKQYNYHNNYRGKWYSPDELDTIVDILKEVE